jgi:hypothetical protein
MKTKIEEAGELFILVCVFIVSVLAIAPIS